MIAHAINDPMLVLEALDDFEPEIILMDMYMPVCTGMELANAYTELNDPDLQKLLIRKIETIVEIFAFAII